MSKSKVWTLYNGNTIIMKPVTIANAEKIISYFLENSTVKAATKTLLEAKTGIRRQNQAYVLMALSMREKNPLIRLTTTFVKKGSQWVNIQLVSFIGDRSKFEQKK